MKPELKTSLGKESVKELLKICSSDTDREVVRYGMAEASGLSAEQLKKKFGFRSIHAKKEKVLIAVQKATEIRKNVNELARIKERAVLQNLGVEISEYESSGNSSSKSDDDGWCSNASTDNDETK